MDFAYIVCVLATSLFLQASFGQEAEVPDSQTASFQVKISPESQELLFQAASNRVLSCQSSTSDTNEKPVLHWEFNDVKVTSTSKSDRIRVENISADKLWLRIDNVQSSDGGTYRCVGTLGTETDSRSVRIEVYETIALKSPPAQFGIYGQQGVLNCEASGHPPPSYTWQYENGTNIVDNDRIVVMPNQLTIKNLTFEDNGVYLCDVTAIQTGESLKLTIAFEVVKLPVIEEEPVVKPPTAKVKDTVTISCQAVGVPPPTYQFKKGDTLLPESQVDSTEGILTITDLKLADEGNYMCVASNKGGSVEASVFLDVKIPPTIRDMPDETEAKEGDEKQVTCVADGDPAPTVTWEKDGDNIDEDARSEDGPQLTEQIEGDEASTGNKTVSKTLNFVTIRPSHGGKYTCTAASGVGIVSKLVTLNVKYAPNFNTNYKETVFYGWRGHTTNMTCLVSANEVATIKWFKSSDSEPGVSEELTTNSDVYILGTTQTWPEHHLSSSSLLVQDADENKGVFGEYECEAENSLGSERQTVKLIKAVTPGRPEVRITKVLPTMVTVEIDVPKENGGQPVLGYYYSYYPVNDTSEDDDSRKNKEAFEAAAEGTTTYLSLHSLLTHTKYVVTVTARNSVGKGEATTTDFETSVVSKPAQLNMTSAREGSEPTSYEVTWSEPYNGGSPITEYIIKYKKVTVVDAEAPQWEAESDVDKAFQLKRVKEPSISSYTIDNLERNSFYEIRITAKNSEGESVEEAKIIKTSEGGAIQSGQAVEEGEGRGVEENTDDSNENSVNVGVVDDGKEEEDDDEKTGDTLGQKSQTDGAASATLGSGTVIGIIVGILILIFIITVVLFLVFKRKPELVGRLRGLGGKGGEEERGKSDDGKDPAEEEKLIKKEDAVKVENETDEGKPEQAVEEAQEEFEPDSKPEAQPTPDAGAPQGDKSPELSAPAPTTEIKITPETPEQPENPPA